MRKYLLTYAIFLAFGTGLCAQCCSAPQGLVCDDAVFICGQELDGYSYTMASEISPGNVFPSLCEGGQADNIYWYAFVACESLVQLRITPTNCSVGEAGLMGVQAGIHANCDLSEPVVCFTAGTTSSFVLGANAFIPGQVYYFFIDGNGGSVCDIRIDLIAGIDTSDHLDEVEANLGTIADLEPGQVEGSTEGCGGMSSTYTFVKPECLDYLLNDISCMEGIDDNGFLCYEWSVTPATGFSFLDDVNCGNSVIISYDVPGVYEVSVTVSNSGYGACIGNSDCTTILPLTVTISQPDTTFLPTEYICNNDCISFCGQIICEERTVVCVEDSSNCKVTIQEIELLSDEIIDLGTKWVCSNSCFTFNGSSYCGNGTYNVADPIECNISYDFLIETFDLIIEGAEELTLTCNDTELSPMTNVVTNYTGSLHYEWRDDSNQIIGTDLNPSFSKNGTFTLEVWSDENLSCLYDHTVVVVVSQDQPQFDLSIPILDCKTSADNILVQNINNIQTVNWNGPNGYFSDEQSPLVDEPGEYTLSLTDQNGCSRDSIFWVTSDMREPNFEVSHDQIDCIKTSTEVSYQADIQIMMQEWEGPDDFYSTDPTLTIFKGGTYSLMLTSTNGCTRKSYFDITEKTTSPSIQMEDVLLWQCNTVDLEVSPIILQANQFNILWSSSTGTIQSDPSLQMMSAGSVGSYYVEVINTENGCTTLDSVIIRKNENIPIDIQLDAYRPSCYDENDGYIENLEVIGGQGPYQYLLNDNLTSAGDWVDLESGNYTLEAMDANGCVVATSFEFINPEEIFLDLPESLEITYGNVTHLTLIHNVNPEDVASIEWYSNSHALIGQGETIQLDGQIEGEITAILLSIDGCQEESTVRLLLDTERDIIAPNIFSPNGDGHNDRFIPMDIDGDGHILELMIYDRMGQRVFRQENIVFGEEAQGWDGTMNGQPLLPGVYVYIVKYDSLKGQPIVKAGDLTLVR